MFLIYFLKNKDIKREEDITGLLEVTVLEGCLLGGDSSRESFCFAMSVLSSTRRTTTVKFLAMTAFQCILIPLFIIVDTFALVVPYLFSVRFVCP